MCCFSACLHHHVSHNHDVTQRKDNHLVTQRRCAYNDNFGVVTEQSYLLVENHKNDGPGQKKRETDLGAKPKNFFRPIVELGTITETTHGLKTLA